MSAPAPPLRLVIVEDEPLARELLASFTARHADLDLVGEAADGEAAVRTIEATRPDLVLLDVEMPVRDGFGVVAELRRRRLDVPLLVFATAFDSYAVRAFEINAVDYLLKPITGRRFDEAIERCRRRRALDRGGSRRLLEDALHLPPQRLLVRSRQRVVPVPVDAIDWIQAEGDYVRLHAGARRYLIEKNLGELARILAPRGFARIHRSTVVNLARVEDLRPLGSGRYAVTLTDGRELTASRTYAARFRADLL